MVETLNDDELDETTIRSIASLAMASFESEKTIEQRIEEIKTIRHPGSLRFIVRDQWQSVIAHARIFMRTVKSETHELTVWALASVCSAPKHRGQGYGVEVTEAAFQHVGREELPKVALFQTPVPKFYEKLDCRVVTNSFVDSTNSRNPNANPWKDESIMIFPRTFDWPVGTIDLNGPGY